MRFAIHLSLALVFVFSITLAQPGFNRITCGGNITLNLKQGDTCTYASAGDSKTDNSNKMIFEVYNNTLHIESGLSGNSIANVEVKDLKGLNINGTAKVFCTNTLICDELKAEFNGAAKGVLKLESANLFLEANGAAQIELEGKCISGSIMMDGAAKVNAKKCVFTKCEVVTNGASVCSIDSVTSDLKVEAKGASKIYLSKIPEVYVSSRNGAGKVYEGNNHDTTIRVETNIVINDDAMDSIKGYHKKYHYGQKDAGFNWSGLDLGLTGMLNASNSLKAPAGYEYLDMNNATSLQVNLNLFEKDLKIHQRFIMAMIGCGFSWKNFKFTSPDVIQPYAPTLTAIRDSGKVLNSNKLRVSYFNIPVLLGFNTSQNEKKAFHLALGVVTGLRLGAMTKTAIGKNKEKTFATFNTDQVCYDFMVRIKYKWANIWASYSLNGFFKKDQGPEIHPVAVGINVLEF